MTTYYVLSEPCSNNPNGDLIVTDIWNPKPGQVIAEFTAPEIEFNPMTYLTKLDEVKRLHDETRAKAEKFLADWQSAK
jgi:hypothetical protein